MIFISIIWNYFDEIPTDICKYIGQTSAIQIATFLNLNTCFDEFVQEVYICNGLKEEYIGYKIAEMERLPRKNVIVIQHRIDNPEFEMGLDGRSISKSARMIKSNVRETFKVIYGCTDSAPIIHCTDNEKETRLLCEIVEKYCARCSHDLIVV